MSPVRDVIESGDTADHHALATHEVVLLLGTDAHRGLTEAEVGARLAAFGTNALPTARREPTWRRLARQFHHPLVYVLLAAAAVSVPIGELVEAAVILGVVVANAVVGFVQEGRAQAALDALRALVRTNARVVRDGRVRLVPSESLVPGDLIVLEAGDRVPADARLVAAAELAVDESALTGESVPVGKDEVVLEPDTPVADRRNMVYSGTLVTAGSGRAVVVATGGDTELGEIHRLVGTTEAVQTPLTRKLARFSQILTVAILALAAGTFAVGLARGQSAHDTFMAAIALAVGAIPEGLPAVVTITLAIGMTRMARRQAVIRRLPAVETLGSTTVIGSDKTGTLTANEMTVEAVWLPHARLRVTGAGYGPAGEIRTADGAAPPPERDRAWWWCLAVAALCNDSRLVADDGRWRVVGDPTEGALLRLARKAGLDTDALRADHPRRGVVPFSSARAFMATLHTTPDGSRVVAVKGAVERVLARTRWCLDAGGTRRPVVPERVLAAAEELAADGLRVLALAVGTGEGPEDAFGETGVADLALCGLVAMADPPRPGARAAVAACRRAGIAVKMITGDHATTAAAVARRIGVLDEAGPGCVLTGAELAGLDDAELPEAVERAAVFARVAPEQKLRIVEALQDRGHVVAMTGDGVNDAPALRRADIGVAMGRSGTEVAKEAADMVLLDDDFSTIEAAVEEGRTVFANLTKFIAWILPTNAGEGLVLLAAIVAGTTLPILPVQILWINMTTALALGLMLAFEPREADVMDRPPRDPQAPILSRALVQRIVLVGTILAASATWMFRWEQDQGASVAEARTAAINLFIGVKIAYLLTCRSLSHRIAEIGWWSNPWILVGIATQVAAQLAFTYLPPMQVAFGTAAIGAGAWARIAVAAALAGGVVSLEKRLRRRPVV
jgi:cation-transporting ATPase F